MITCLCPEATVMVTPLLVVNGPTVNPFCPVEIVPLTVAVSAFNSTAPIPPPIALAVNSAGYVTNTSFVPALKLTNEPELLDEMTVVRASVVPDEVYVPMPTSHSESVWLAIV